jgi:hypothetical protein
MSVGKKARTRAEPKRWGPDVLYRGRSMERRIMLLEVMAWLIEHVETFRTRDAPTETSQAPAQTLVRYNLS